MADKISLVTLASGYNLAGLNQNFKALQDALNDQVLYRENPDNTDNAMSQSLDMNGKDILNVGTLHVSKSFEVDGVDLVAQVGIATGAATEALGYAEDSSASATASAASAAQAKSYAEFTTPALVPSLKQVATRCRYPNSIVSPLQVYSSSLHKAMDDIEWMVVGFANYYGAKEIDNTAALTVMTLVEYPIGSGAWTFITYNSGSLYGTIQPGRDILSDPTVLSTKIPKGEMFRLYHYHYSEGGIPCSFGGTGGNFPSGPYKEILGGSNTMDPPINPYMLYDASYLDMDVTNVPGVTAISPICILTNTTVKSYGILGDSRSANMAGLNGIPMDAPSDNNYLVAVSERTIPSNSAFINLSAGGDAIRLFKNELYGNKRMAYLRFVTNVMNSFGTNDFEGWTSENLIEQDIALASRLFITGKPLATMTVPPKVTSTDYFTSYSGQTANADDANRIALNNYRKSSSIYTEVFDLDGVNATGVTGKWDIWNTARSFAMSSTSGSNVITSASLFVPADAGKFIVLPGALGTSPLIGKVVYVDASTVQVVHPYSGLAINATATVTDETGYASALKMTWDGTHENQYACQLYQDSWATSA